MGIFMGTMLPHSAHKPICTKEKWDLSQVAKPEGMSRS
jgi:hypothetical protein